MKGIFYSFLIITAFTNFIHAQPNNDQIGMKKLTFSYKKIDNLELLVDVYQVDTAGMQPVILFFHGGGFIFGNREHGLKSALRDALLKEKYTVVSVDYRLAPETNLKFILQDAMDAYDWLIREGEQLFNVDTRRIIVAGSSAGGVLAMHTALNEVKPKAVVLISSPTDYSSFNWVAGDTSIYKSSNEYKIVGKNEISYGGYNERLSLYLYLRKNNLWLYEVCGFDPSKDINRLKKLLPINNLAEDYSSTFVAHAKNDKDVLFNEAEVLDSALNKFSIAHKSYFVENGHSSRLIKNNPEVLSKITQFIKEQLQTK